MAPQPELMGQLPGSIAIEDDGGRRVLQLRGDLDSAVVARFREVQGRAPVVIDAIDAGAVTFISSTGLAVMLRAVEDSAAAGRSPVLRSWSHTVDRVLRISGIDHLIARGGGTSEGTSGSTSEGADDGA